MINTPVYIYTVPKSGTYLLANFLEELGYRNTGRHISLGSYLDTLNFDSKVNKEAPSSTEVKQFYIETFRQLKPKSFAFGHFCPTQLPNPLASRLSFVSCYRDPKQVLQSEFIDFRYRRRDIHYLLESEIQDPFLAFENYMEVNAPIIRNIFVNFLLFQLRYSTKITREVFGNRNIVINFKNIVSEAYCQEDIMISLCSYFKKSAVDISSSLEKAKLRDNKTKSTSLELPFKRNELWTKKALSTYKRLGFMDIEKYLEKVVIRSQNLYFRKIGIVQ